MIDNPVPTPGLLSTPDERAFSHRHAVSSVILPRAADWLEQRRVASRQPLIALHLGGFLIQIALRVGL